MIDIEKIRQQPELFRAAAKTKRVAVDIDQLLELDGRRRTLRTEIDNAREKRNKLSDLVVSAAAEQKAPLIAQSREVGTLLADSEKQFAEIEDQFLKLMSLVPSPPANGTPEGLTDQDNVEIRREGNLPQAQFSLRDHLELVRLHGLAEFETARPIAGSRAYALKGLGVLLEMAVLRLALDITMQQGFIPVSPPLMVRANAMYGTGYFPLGEENAYELERDKLFLTGTSEVGMVAMQMERLFGPEELPLKLAGISTCFRREAGAAGKDTKGLYRVHQFQKVEQVVFCRAEEEESLREHMALLWNSEQVLKALELPYRVVAVCTGDMGLGQVLKHDIETWMPSRNAYGETHSCSSFYDFQARRLNIRYKEGASKKYVFTLNNTAIASPRILIALLENHQQEDGSIYIPQALRPYMQGVEKIS